MVTRIDICNRAMTNTGMEPLESEEADGADTVINIYEASLDLLLSLYPWSFNRQLRQLSSQEEPPGAHWRYRFNLPADRVGPPTAIYTSKEDVDSNRTLRLFAFDGDNGLLADHPVLWIRFPGRPSPAFWPGYFRVLVQTVMERDLAIAGPVDKGLRDRKHQDAFGTPSEHMEGGLMGVARRRDAASTPAQELVSEGGDLIEARGYHPWDSR